MLSSLGEEINCYDTFAGAENVLINQLIDKELFSKF